MSKALLEACNSATYQTGVTRAVVRMDHSVLYPTQSRIDEVFRFVRNQQVVDLLLYLLPERTWEEVMPLL